MTALLAVVAATFMLAGPLRDQLAVMDPVWVAVLAQKDYLLPSEWPLLTWFGNLGLAAVIAGVYRYRRRLSLASRRERGLVVGCGVLLLLFLVSVPLAAAHFALAVQLQLSRIFWLLDTVAVAYAAWVVIESPVWSTAAPAARRAVVATAVIASLGRGGYVTWVERSGEPLVRTDLTATEWTQVMRWASVQPVGTHFLADPGHAWRYGSSVRVASGRDVYLEEIKDIGIAIYSGAVAHRVARRIDSLGDFASLDARRARALALQYDLDYLVTQHPIDLPRAHQSGRFTVHDLRTDDRRAASRLD